MAVKPTRFVWADDDVYGAGGDPWSGQPNKVVPAAGRRSEGYVPELRPAAAHWNYLLNEVGLIIDDMHAKIIMRNWKAVATSTPSFFNEHAVHGRYLPSTKAFMFINSEAKIIVSQHYHAIGSPWWGGKGEYFEPESNPGSELSWTTIGAGSADVAEYNFITNIRLAVGNLAVDQVGMSAGLGIPWVSLVTGLTGTYKWNRVEMGTNWPTVFGVIAGGNGVGAGAIAYAQSSAWVETAYTTGDIVALKSNKNSSAHLMVCCSDAGELGTSIDGITWAFQTISPAESIEDFAYSSMSGRWIGINKLGNLWFSDDAGVTWARYAGWLSNFGDITSLHVTIAANDKYCWVVTSIGTESEAASGEHMQWVSFDDGDSWERVTRNDTEYVGSVASGGGRFVAYGKDDGVATLIGDFGP